MTRKIYKCVYLCSKALCVKGQLYKGIKYVMVKSASYELWIVNSETSVKIFIKISQKLTEQKIPEI